MDKRKFASFLRQSNTADLLDDGIENGSDLKSRARTEKEAPDAPPGHALDEPAASPAQEYAQHQQQAPETAPPAASVSYLGLFLGVSSLAAGIMLLVDPHDLRIFHSAMRYRGSIEHVTAFGSQTYGVLALIFGIALCWYALYRPKN